MKNTFFDRSFKFKVCCWTLISTLFLAGGCGNGENVSVQDKFKPKSTDEFPPNQKTDHHFFQDYFQMVTKDAVNSVEQHMSQHSELSTPRKAVSLHRTDSCDPLLKQRVTFGERISYQIYLHASAATVPGIQDLGPYFGWGNKVLSSNSLVSHKMCSVTAETLEKTLGSASKVPSQKTVDQISRFTSVMNQDRLKGLAGQKSNMQRFFRNYNRLVMCLAYMESLPTADSADSYNTAKKFAPNFKKPEGVEFYEDDLQPETSSLNIGLFQFAPKETGNVFHCLKSWNATYKTCTKEMNLNELGMIQILGSGYQTFNAFCGVNKILQTYSVQINTEKAIHTHPENLNQDGKLKPANDRCVSPFFSSKLAYNHYGPLQNSYDQILEKLMSCVDSTIETQ